MTDANVNSPCRTLRDRLHRIMSDRFGSGSEWVRNHAAVCPRCRLRLAATGRVNLALSVIKSQPHRLDLLMRANTRAVDALKHDLRRAPKAQRLRTMLPAPKLLDRWSTYKHSAAGIAACIAILVLMKLGVFSSMTTFTAEGRKVLRYHYASRAGEDLANDIFTA